MSLGVDERAEIIAFDQVERERLAARIKDLNDKEALSTETLLQLLILSLAG